MMKVFLVLVMAGTGVGAAIAQSQSPQTTATCEGLASLTAPNTTITLARAVDAGAFNPSASGSTDVQTVRVPTPFCRVAASVKPSSDSDITVEIWMPLNGWNGKLQAVGNGAFNGTIGYSAMTGALARGYAATSTDTGHSGGGAKWALGHPEKVTDFGWRAVHEMTVVAKRVVTAFYGSSARRAYWTGCSAGGRQGLQAAQRFPEDFDGIVAGAPGLDWTGRAASALRIAKLLEQNEAARLPAASRRLLHDAVLAACDGADGVKDGVLENPAQCTFDPASLACRGGDRATCLTAKQVATAQAIYASPANPRTKREIPGLARGSELGWTDLGWTASARATGLDQFRYLVFGEPNWSVHKFDFAADVAKAEEADGNTINALNPDLGKFIARGGRLIQYHGWSDPQISPGISPQYYRRVVEALGGESNVRQAYRLFMAPGMGHCSGGEGPNTFDMLAALERWVEAGTAPDRIVASRATNGVVERTRPLCPYPQVAVYKGTGSVDEEASFACK